MSTFIERLRDDTNELSSLLSELLHKHSSIYKWNTQSRGMRIHSVEGDYSYKDLKPEGYQLQSRIMELYKKHHSLLSTMLANEPEETFQELKKLDNSITRIIEQKITKSSCIEDENEKVSGLLKSQVALLERLHGSSSVSNLYIPDTNALIYSPSIESWSFDGANKIEIILLATVLSELDYLKINNKNEDVRKKAEKLIRQIKEYRSRGALTQGVTIVKNRISLRTIALEPRMEQSLPWFDPTNNDDRFLAATIEVLKKHLKSEVTLITGDINLQNKAEFSRVPFLEPPIA